MSSWTVSQLLKSKSEEQAITRGLQEREISLNSSRYVTTTRRSETSLHSDLKTDLSSPESHPVLSVLLSVTIQDAFWWVPSNEGQRNSAQSLHKNKVFINTKRINFKIQYTRTNVWHITLPNTRKGTMGAKSPESWHIYDLQGRWLLMKQRKANLRQIVAHDTATATGTDSDAWNSSLLKQVSHIKNHDGHVKKPSRSPSTMTSKHFRMRLSSAGMLVA